MDILSAIVASKKIGLQNSSRRGCFRDAISGKDRVSLIAEIKNASPSEGVICDDVDPCEIASVYEYSGASAISVVTEEKFFGGNIDMLREVRSATKLPILRKDFVIDQLQIYESKIAGADAVLLIAAILDDEQLRCFREIAEGLGMDVLCEVHDACELERSLRSGARIIGINNRDLRTFSVDIETTLSLSVPDDVVLVSESGIRDAIDVRRLKGTADAVLVGTAILKADKMAHKVHDLSRDRPLLKICGIQDLETARFCEDIGVDFIGFNFCVESPRYIPPAKAREIIKHLGSGIKTVAVFASEKDCSTARDFDYVQIHSGKPVIRCGVLEFPLFDLQKGVSGKIDLDSDFPYPCFVAGGLTAADVRGLSVFAVDVARGVETNGKKDLKKIAKFLKNLSL